MPNSALDPGELTSDAALLVVDAQDCFIDSLSDKASFLARCAFSIDAAQALGIQTVFTEQVPDKLGKTRSDLIRRARTPAVFPKTSFSALNAPDLKEFLGKNEIYHLLVCGLETPICIYQTGLQAASEDFDLTFLSDALGCRRPEDASFALQALQQLGCPVLPSETVFYSVLSEATHPHFRAFSQLVKIYSEPDFSIEKRLEDAPEFPQERTPKPTYERPKRSRGRSHRNSKRTTDKAARTPSDKKSPKADKPIAAKQESTKRAPKPDVKKTKPQAPKKAEESKSPPRKTVRKTAKKRVARKPSTATKSAAKKKGRAPKPDA